MPDKKINRSSEAARLRQKAEKRLEDSKGNTLDRQTSNQSEMFHELQVHQMELEIQNEELRRVQNELQESRNRYLDLYDYAPTGYFTLNSNYTITGLNLTGAQMLRLEREHLQNFLFTHFIDQEETDRFYLYFKRASTSNSRLTLELKMHRADKSLFFARLESLKASPDELRLSLIDITDRKHAEDALVKAKEELELKVKERTAELQQSYSRLQQSEEKYRRIVETAGEGIISLDPDGCINFVNIRITEMLGYPAQETLGKPFLNFVDRYYRSRLKTGLENSKQGIVNSNEIKCQRRDGGVLWVRVNMTPFFDSQGQYAGSLGLLTDVTQEKQIRDQLQNYAKRITQVQEEERKRIAYELHDDTAQYLSILKLELDSLLESGKIQIPEIVEKLQYLEKDASRAVEDIRRYSHELRPGVLDHLGLSAALEQLAEDINRLQQIEVVVCQEGEEPEMPDEVKLGLFRIAQEALSNSRKHSNATHVSVSLIFTDSRVNLAVTDNGVGFNVQEASARSTLKGSLGLMSMHERAELIGAHIKIESEPGKGTKVLVEAHL